MWDVDRFHFVYASIILCIYSASIESALIYRQIQLTKGLLCDNESASCIESWIRRSNITLVWTDVKIKHWLIDWIRGCEQCYLYDFYFVWLRGCFFSKWQGMQLSGLGVGIQIRRPWVQIPGGAGWESFSIPPCQLLCRRVCAWPPFMCTARLTQICAHVKDPITVSICR